MSVISVVFRRSFTWRRISRSISSFQTKRSLAKLRVSRDTDKHAERRTRECTRCTTVTQRLDSIDFSARVINCYGSATLTTTTTTTSVWLCAVRGCRRTATELSRLPPLEFGTVCHITSRLHSHCLFSAVVWRLISSDAVFLDYNVVPAKWQSSLWIR